MSESETPKQGEVIITYIRENDGKEIQKPRQDTPNSPYDTPYNTTEEGENLTQSRLQMVRHTRSYQR